MTVDQCDDPTRFGLEQKPRADDGIAADVPRCTATLIRVVPNVCRIDVVVAEKTGDHAYVSQFAAAHDLPGAQPLRMKPHHESLEDDSITRRLAQSRRVRSVKPDRFLAEHVFPRAG